MAVKEHPLFKELLHDVMSWAQPQLEKPRQEEDSQFLFRRVDIVPSSATQRYQLNSYYWCSRLVSIFHRLAWIRDMTSRSVRKRKNERSSVLLQQWTFHNYEHYTVLYQAILEVSLLLANEVLELGNPYRKCSYSTVCDNTHVNGTSVHRTLEKLKDTTEEHHQGKNLLVHQGQQIKPPSDAGLFESADVISMVMRLGMAAGTDVELAAQFVTMHSRKELIRIMKRECSEIESQVEELLNALLPYYDKYRATRS